MDENNIFFLAFKYYYMTKIYLIKNTEHFFIIVNFTWFLFTYFENILLEQLSLENNQILQE